MRLELVPAIDHPELLAAPVFEALKNWKGTTAVEQIQVAPINAELADTAAFCAEYEVGMDVSANCVIVAGKRGEDIRYAACVVLATTRADVNGMVRKHIDARKVSFASMDDATALSFMEYGGITPVGLPAEWPVLIDSAVAATDYVIVGSGIRASKIWIPGAALAEMANAEVLEGMAKASA